MTYTTENAVRKSYESMRERGVQNGFHVVLCYLKGRLGIDRMINIKISFEEIN
jgi:hypothetical protein